MFNVYELPVAILDTPWFSSFISPVMDNIIFGKASHIVSHIVLILRTLFTEPTMYTDPIINWNTIRKQSVRI